MEETPVAEVSTTEGHYGVEAMLDSGAGASVCSPNDFPTVAIDTKTEVTKVYRCAAARELRVYGYKCSLSGYSRSWARHNKSCRYDSVNHGARRVATHHCPIMPSAGRMGPELWRSSGGSNRNTQNDSEKAWVDTENGTLLHPTLVFIVQQTQPGDAERQEHAFHKSEEQEQQELGETRVPIAPSDEERRYHNLTRCPYKELCEYCVRGRGRNDRHHTEREADQQGTPVVQLDSSFLTDGEYQVPLLGGGSIERHR
eukprot:6492157-Amphidinium_carterae.6